MIDGAMVILSTRTLEGTAMRRICWAILLAGLMAAVGCSKHHEQVDQPAPPVETPAQFEARRDAEVKRQVAENRARREAQDAQDLADAKRVEDQKSAAMLAKFEALVRKSLKDPESAVFSEVKISATGQGICGLVNARNGFGGYTGVKRFTANDDHVFIRSDDLAYTFDVIEKADGCGP